MTAAATVAFTLDGQAVTAHAGESLLDAARRAGVAIPHLCAAPGLTSAGNCRACMVEIDGERVLAASCCRLAKPGMVVHSHSARARHAQALVLELLLADQPERPSTRDNELLHWCERLGVSAARWPRRSAIADDQSHPAIAVRLDACIQCTRCVRACRDAQGNDVIGLAFRGESVRVVFDMDDPLAASTCVACGECVQACPTGALMPAGDVALATPERSVDTLCPYCGVGCQMRVHVRGDAITHVEGRDGPANASRLCVKGRYGFDYGRHPQRLTQPLIRRADAAKDASLTLNPDDWASVFRPATWGEALAFAAGGLTRIRDSHGGRALAGFGSAKGSNEEAYLFQKLVRMGFGSHNVDHCTRLCHASSVAALLEGIGSGAVSNPVRDVMHADVIVIVGANPTVNHPVAATWIKNAVQQGSRLIVIDPRRSDLTRLATHHLQFNASTDVALFNALMHVIHQEDLIDHDFIATRTTGFDAFASNLGAFSPEAMAPICGVPAATLREVARLYATAPNAMILWGMGVSQHVHGTDNARCLIALALMTGQIGRPGTGLHPLRGQNNVQGASDAGLIPMMLPDYQPVASRDVRERFEQAWGMAPGAMDSSAGLTVVETLHAARRGEIKGMYILGENPAMSDPDVDHARQALTSLEHLVVQDIFLTETAALADVVLPAGAFAEKTGSFTNTDRCVQLGRPALGLPGDARQDLWIIQQMAHGLGLAWSTQSTGEVFDEMRALMPSIAGISWERLQREGAVTYPCLNTDDPGQSVVFQQSFPRPDGRARFVPAVIVDPDERPDAEYPLVLITGRHLEHWHTGSMTRRSAVLDALEPDAVASLHPDELARLGVAPGAVITVSSRRGSVSLYARADDATPPGAVFVAFCYAEAAINKLTNDALDPTAKIPEFKYCAVRVVAGGAEPPTRR